MELTEMAERLEKLHEHCITKYNLEGYNCFFIGPTGSGKSTLVSLLNGYELKVEVRDGSYNINHTNQKLVIGNNDSESQTSIAESVSFNNVQYWDCPGFEDSKGLSQQLLIAYNIYYLLRNANQFKIVLVLSESDFDSGRHRLFVEQLNILANYFPDLNNIWDGVIITISKVVENDCQETYNSFIKGFETIVEDKASIITSAARQLLKRITALNNLFVITNPQCINEHYQFPNETIQKLNNLLQKCSYSMKGNVQMSIDVTIKQELQKRVQEVEILLLKNTAEIQQQLIKRIRQKLINCQYQELENIRIVLQQIQQIQNLAELLVQINVKDYKFIGITQDICAQLTSYSSQTQIYISLTRLLSINEPINLQPLTLQQWIHYYMNIQINRQNSTLYIFGMIISTQTIQEKYMNTNDKEQLTNINVYCKDTFILSSNMTFNGVNLQIYAKNWKTCNIPVTIDLSGKDGEIHEQIKALNGQGQDAEGNGKSGMDGLHGNHGQNGGNFNGIGRNYDDLSQLTIITSGGKGSNGQDGGDGSHGLDGIDDEIGPIMERHPDTLVSRRPYEWQQQDDGVVKTIAKLYAQLNRKFIEEYQSNTTVDKRGGNGGDGGTSGLAGISGKAGIVNIKDYNPSPHQIINTKHQDGVRGQPGAIGNRGIRYQYKGKYQNEFLFTYARDDAQEINQTNEYTENQELQNYNIDIILSNASQAVFVSGAATVAEATILSEVALIAQAGFAASLGATFGIGLVGCGLLCVASSVIRSGWIDKPTKVLAKDTKNGVVRQVSGVKQIEQKQPQDAPENDQLIQQYQQDICNRIPDIETLSNNNVQN